MAALVVTGCGAEEITEGLTEQAVGVDAEIGDPEAELPEEVEADDEFAPDDERYPEALPEELPLPGGMELVDASTEDVDGATVVTIETTDLEGLDEMVRFFEEELPAAGWTITDLVREDEEGLRVRHFEVEGHGTTGFVEVREEGETGDIGDTDTRLLVELRTSG